jgi:hypothetical protein
MLFGARARYWEFVQPTGMEVMVRVVASNTPYSL